MKFATLLDLKVFPSSTGSLKSSKFVSLKIKDRTTKKLPDNHPEFKRPLSTNNEFSI